MSFNYNPSDYLIDYSWVGEMGQHLSQVATKFPSLMKLNKEIKENREYSKIAKAQTAEMISGMENETAINLASEMGLGNLPANEAKLSLIKTIPDHGDMNDIKSAQEYTKKLADQFYIPMFQAGQTYNARTNTDKLTPGALVASLKAGKIRGEVAKSPEMQREMELAMRGRTDALDVKKAVDTQKGVGDASIEQRGAEEDRVKQLEYARGKQISDVFGQNLPEGTQVTPDDVFNIEGLLLKDEQISQTVEKAMRTSGNKTEELLNEDVDTTLEFINKSQDDLAAAEKELATLDPKKKENKSLLAYYQKQVVAKRAAVEGSYSKLRELASKDLDRAKMALRALGETEFLKTPLGADDKAQTELRGGRSRDLSKERKAFFEERMFGDAPGGRVVGGTETPQQEGVEASPVSDIDTIINMLPEDKKQKALQNKELVAQNIQKSIDEIGLDETLRKLKISGIEKPQGPVIIKPTTNQETEYISVKERIDEAKGKGSQTVVLMVNGKLTPMSINRAESLLRGLVPKKQEPVRRDFKKIKDSR